MCITKIKNFKKIIKEKLSKKRYIHCINVAKQAVYLAEVYGEDKNKAYIAGLMHDITKEVPEDKQLNLINTYRINLGETSKNSPKVWHEKTGAAYLKNELNIEDQDILNAVKYHTTGRANMSLLEKIVYISDLTSEERSYPDVERIRELAKSDIDRCMLECLKFSLLKLSSRDMTIDEDTFFAYNYYLKKVNNMEEILL